MRMYDYWFDANGKAHEIKSMDSQYILNCLNQLKNMLDLWGGIIPERLTEDELKLKDEVGMKAWFVFHGIAYINKFCEELNNRKGE